MSDPNHKSIGEDEFLTVRVAGPPGQPERLLLIGHPREGVVRVREWTTATLNSEGEDYEMAPSELLEELETELAAQRDVSEEMYKIRRWLEG